jgi:hypothetical protein
LFTGEPNRNTEYNKRLSWPLLAPTIKSAPDMVLEKLSLDSLRICSTPSNTKTLMVIAIQLNTTELFLSSRLLVASLISIA